MKIGTTFNQDSICVVADCKSLRKPDLYIAVLNGQGPICDNCHMQADCHEVWGDKGSQCPIHKDGERWERIDRSKQVVLRDLLMKAD